MDIALSDSFYLLIEEDYAVNLRELMLAIPEPTFLQLFNQVIITLLVPTFNHLKTISNNQLTLFLRLTAQLSKSLPPSTATHKGHMK